MCVLIASTVTIIASQINLGKVDYTRQMFFLFILILYAKLFCIVGSVTAYSTGIYGQHMPPGTHMVLPAAPSHQKLLWHA